MRSQNTRSGGEGLERSCTGTAGSWLAGPEPVEGVELLHAWLSTEVYQRHRHDTYAVGVTDRGVQVVDLYPDEAHDGRAGTGEGFGYRIVYLEPARLAEALRALRGGPGALPFVSEAVSANPALARAVEDAFRGPLNSLSADSIVVDLADALLAAERHDARPAVSRLDVR